jgi:hypothetical protein
MLFETFIVEITRDVTTAFIYHAISKYFDVHQTTILYKFMKLCYYIFIFKVRLRKSHLYEPLRRRDINLYIPNNQHAIIFNFANINRALKFAIVIPTREKQIESM